MTNILEYFPFDTPRNNQIIALEWLAEQEAKYLLLEAPVGVGKSAIGLCLSQYLKPNYGSSFILTPQKILQDQYTRSFSSRMLNSLYGKNNYACIQRKTSCDIGSLVKPSCDNCPHKSALQRAIIGSNTVMNYALGLSLFAFTPVFAERGRRELMILDECHTLEEHLTEFNAVVISKFRCKQFNIKETEWPDTTKTTIFEALDWVREVYLPALSKYLVELFHQVEPLLEIGDSMTKTDAKLIKRYMRLEDHSDAITEFVLTKEATLNDEFVLVFDKTNFKFKQVTGAKNFHDILKPMGNRFLFMSSTILNKEGFCKDLGLPEDDTAFLSLDSEFPVDKRPVLYRPTMKMNQGWDSDERKDELNEMGESVKQVAEMHKNDSGIIHTANFKLSKWVVEVLETWPENNHRILHHNPSDKFKIERGDVIDDYIKSDVPTILVSPSITEGLDLIDDLARFAVFLKVPFGYLGDQWIKRRLQMSREWYERQALIEVIQGGGRIVRSETDWGVVYILDKSWGYLHYRSSGKIPPWWNKAYSKI